jgi:tetratricopeptide (TPR) repeat protein
MGFLDSLFGKKKMTLDDANKVNQQYTAQNPVPASNENAMMRQATSCMTSGKFQESIDLYQQLATAYPARKDTYLSQIGAGHYFLGDYMQAIDYYVQARDLGSNASMMDDNIWEACETIYKNTQDKAAIERYFALCPSGSHGRAANKLLGK